MFIVFVNKTIDFPDPAVHIGRFKLQLIQIFNTHNGKLAPACWTQATRSVLVLMQICYCTGKRHAVEEE